MKDPIKRTACTSGSELVPYFVGPFKVLGGGVDLSGQFRQPLLHRQEHPNETYLEKESKSPGARPRTALLEMSEYRNGTRDTADLSADILLLPFVPLRLLNRSNRPLSVKKKKKKEKEERIKRD